MNLREASEMVSQVGNVYADLVEHGKLVKSRSDLPCSWYRARESFMLAYESEYSVLPDSLRDAYQQVYAELAFFVDDEIAERFGISLEIASRHRIERLREVGIMEDERTARLMIASISIKIQEREAIWQRLSDEESCPRSELLLLFETMTYCGEMYRAMWDEWAAFANLVAYRQSGSRDT